MARACRLQSSNHLANWLSGMLGMQARSGTKYSYTPLPSTDATDSRHLVRSPHRDNDLKLLTDSRSADPEPASTSSTAAGNDNQLLYYTRAGANIRQMLVDKLDAPVDDDSSEWGKSVLEELDLAAFVNALSAADPRTRAGAAVQCRRLINDLLERDPRAVAATIKPYIDVINSVIENTVIPKEDASAAASENKLMVERPHPLGARKAAGGAAATVALPDRPVISTPAITSSQPTTLTSMSLRRRVPAPAVLTSDRHSTTVATASDSSWSSSRAGASVYKRSSPQTTVSLDKPSSSHVTTSRRKRAPALSTMPVSRQAPLAQTLLDTDIPLVTVTGRDKGKDTAKSAASVADTNTTKVAVTVPETDTTKAVVKVPETDTTDAIAKATPAIQEPAQVAETKPVKESGPASNTVSKQVVAPSTTSVQAPLLETTTEQVSTAAPVSAVALPVAARSDTHRAIEQVLVEFSGIDATQLEVGHVELKRRIGDAATMLERVCNELIATPGARTGFTPQTIADEVRKTLKSIMPHDSRVRMTAGALDGGLVYSAMILLFSELIIPKTAALAKLSPATLGLPLSAAISVPMEIFSRLFDAVRDNHLLAQPAGTDSDEINRQFPMPSFRKSVLTFVLLMAGLTLLKNATRMAVPLLLSKPMDRAVVGYIDTGLDCAGSFGVGALGVWLAYKHLYGKIDKPHFLAQPLVDLERKMRQSLDFGNKPPAQPWLAKDIKDGSIAMARTLVSLAALANVLLLAGMIPLLLYTKAETSARQADPALAETQISSRETVLRALDSTLLMALLVGGAVANGIIIGSTIDAKIQKKLGEWMGSMHKHLAGDTSETLPV